MVALCPRPRCLVDRGVHVTRFVQSGDKLIAGKLGLYVFMEDCEFHNAGEFTVYLRSVGYLPFDQPDFTDEDFETIVTKREWPLDKDGLPSWNY